MTKTITFFTSCLALCLLLAGCVEFKKLSLYDGEEIIPPPAKPKKISMIVEPRIYDEDATDVWGLEKNECQEGSVSDVAYSGEESIKISWNRDAKGCKWSGFGIGWDGWAGKDLTPILDYCAIQMYVRTEEGRSFGLPFVLTLIDYSGGMGFAYTSAKYFERVGIDEEWQRIVVPLNAFEMEKENLDPSNIQQLQIELQQSGSVYVDDISLIFYEEPPQEAWVEEEELPSPTRTPLQIMDDDFVNNDGWGTMKGSCKTIEWSAATASKGKKSLYMKWDTQASDNCGIMAIGTSWNKWFPVNLASIRATAAIQFDIKMAEGMAESLPIHIGFEDYERAMSFAPLRKTFVEGGKYTSDWKTVTVPLDAIPAGKMDFKRIKQLYVKLDESGEVFMDNFRLVDF